MRDLHAIVTNGCTQTKGCCDVAVFDAPAAAHGSGSGAAPSCPCKTATAGLPPLEISCARPSRHAAARTHAAGAPHPARARACREEAPTSSLPLALFAVRGAPLCRLCVGGRGGHRLAWHAPAGRSWVTCAPGVRGHRRFSPQGSAFLLNSTCSCHNCVRHDRDRPCLGLTESKVLYAAASCPRAVALAVGQMLQLSARETHAKKPC